MLTGLHELYEADTPSTSEPPYDCLEGLAGARTTDEFFTSLDENDLMPLFGFRDTRAEDPTLVPCLAFVVDIASMSSEINVVKSLIRMLLASEEDEPVRYILVPFNDYGSISSSRFSNIIVMYVADRRSSNINVMYVADRRSSNINVCMYMPASRLHVTLLQGWAVAKHLK